MLAEVRKKLRIKTGPIFNDFTHTGQKLIPGQGLQYICVDQNQAGLVKSADQILTLGDIYPGFTANRAVHLRQKSRRNLKETNAASISRSNKPG